MKVLLTLDSLYQLCYCGANRDVSVTFLCRQGLWYLGRTKGKVLLRFCWQKIESQGGQEMSWRGLWLASDVLISAARWLWRDTTKGERTWGCTHSSSSLSAARTRQRRAWMLLIWERPLSIPGHDSSVAVRDMWRQEDGKMLYVACWAWKGRDKKKARLIPVSNN